VYFGSPGSHDLAVERGGFGLLPAQKAISVSGHVTGADFYLPPLDDQVQNGGFESGGWSAWQPAGSKLPSLTATAHTGQGAALLDSGSGESRLSQSVSVPAHSIQPTLSLMVRLAANAGPASKLKVQVLGTTTITREWTVQDGPWVHVWSDLSSVAGQTVEIRLIVAGAPAVIVDEVSLGSALAIIRSSPAAGDGEPHGVAIAGMAAGRKLDLRGAKRAHGENTRTGKLTTPPQPSALADGQQRRYVTRVTGGVLDDLDLARHGAALFSSLPTVFGSVLKVGPTALCWVASARVVIPRRTYVGAPAASFQCRVMVGQGVSSTPPALAALNCWTTCGCRRAASDRWPRREICVGPRTCRPPLRSMAFGIPSDRTPAGQRCATDSGNHTFARRGAHPGTVHRERPIDEDDVWLGASAIVLGGVTVGRGSVVAAGAVVTHSMPPYSVARGVPAQIVGLRGEETAAGNHG
jgi:hypothetical protein